jgi:hypothetical protein
MTAPLQLVDNFLLDYHVGHVLILLFVLSVLAGVVLRSWRVFALNILLFGVIFLLTPASMLGATPIVFKIFGVALILFGPLTYTVMAR